MPFAVTEAPYRPVPIDPPRKIWTRAECAALEATGLFDQQRLELVEGELIDRIGKNRPHSNTLGFILAWLIRVFGAEFVQAEVPIDVAPEDNPTSEPEPDIIVLSRPSWEFPENNPRPADLCLIVEVSDTTLGFDLTKKAALYARAGIVELWVLDVFGRRLLVHREPANGRYTNVVAYNVQDAVTPLAKPGAEFRVADAFRTA